MKKYKDTPNWFLDQEYKEYMLLSEIEPVNKNSVRMAISLPEGKVNKFAYTHYYKNPNEAVEAAKHIINSGQAEEIQNLPF